MSLCVCQTVANAKATRKSYAKGLFTRSCSYMDASFSSSPRFCSHFSRTESTECEGVSCTKEAKYRQWGQELDAGRVPEGLQAMLEELGSLKREKVVN
ncbi:unnamed protein product [Heterotrigona itama]|uniref:Uncharacterized protein n=1 Tax=Heterotrigona itama TaxID=395501 RepID=A0A6V7HBD6_9HYME|nr:unnamed protein product [Heterotrigona itama]